MTTSPELYEEQLFASLPPGRAWPDRLESNLRQLLLALAVQLYAVDLRGQQVLAELDPGTTFDLLPEWERLLGLPDPCAPPAQTVQERRARVVQRLTVQPHPTKQYLLELCAALGYPDATITESGPHQFTVDVPNPRVTYFRTGASQCGDLLGKIERAADLECLLTEQKPAHLSIIFNYSGV